ncbi:MAG TPA: 2-oxoacid:acceptor oxidoreductase family protein, partial [Gallionella sp.]|nr:2-oxoacid:acceptor oxidoreductase family protein [Gallionella sp.]
LKKDGYILLNTQRSFAELGLGDFVHGRPAERLCTLAATEIGLKHLGRPIPNVPLLAGFAALSGLIRLESVIKAINEKFSGKVADGNIDAAAEAYSLIKARMAEVQHA